MVILLWLPDWSFVMPLLISTQFLLPNHQHHHHHLRKEIFMRRFNKIGYSYSYFLLANRLAVYPKYWRSSLPVFAIGRSRKDYQKKANSSSVRAIFTHLNRYRYMDVFDTNRIFSLLLTIRLSIQK